MKQAVFLIASLAAGVVGGGAWLMHAQEMTVAHAECTYFGPQHDHFAPRSGEQRFAAGAMTARVAGMLGVQPMAAMPSPPGGSRTGSSTPSTPNMIDYYIWQAFKVNGVTPAAQTNDYEFIRRVTLDLTGRIPTANQVYNFVGDTTPNKRAALIETLLASPQWVDRWTMFFGDLYKNASTWPSTGTSLTIYGRDAFNTYIRNALTNATPYNQVAQALIGSQGTNNFTQGELNWIINGRVTGAGIPIQDTWDQEAANVADTFLGIAHMNCLLCHDGRNHLTTLSLWGGNFTRYKAWGFSGFLSHTNLQSPKDSTTGQNLWYVNDAAYKTNYPLNTTTGNRPPRQPTAGETSIPPVYPFNGAGPNSGEGPRQALARLVTSDFQFARATVNYLWAAFFTMGIVDPPDQFDPARLDPNNPPPSPWTLQPSNADLLNALAEDFIASKYDVKHVMRLIANSNTYQLESQYDPNAWNPNWQPLFARKLVRRLWGEEVADSISLSSGIANTYGVGLTTGTTTLNWAMQYPETSIESRPFLQAFLPGNRDDQPRRPDGAIQQALVQMNDNTVMAKLNAAGSGSTASLLTKALAQTDNNGMISMLYMNILSRNPTSTEVQQATTLLGSGTRSQKAQELMWTLYNKVDFLFNY